MGTAPHPNQQTKTPNSELIVPVYIVCDGSTSMYLRGITAINQALLDLHREIALDPLMSDVFHVGLITFADTTEELMSLTKLSDVIAMPCIYAAGQTNFEPVFILLKQIISRDIESLKSGGFEIYRPLVLFITDGDPTDNPAWENSYRSLMDKAMFRQFPNIIAIGFEGADEKVISGVGSVAAMIFDPEAGYPLGLSQLVWWYRENLYRALRAGTQTPIVMAGGRNIEIRQI